MVYTMVTGELFTSNCCPFWGRHFPGNKNMCVLCSICTVSPRSRTWCQPNCTGQCPGTFSQMVAVSGWVMTEKRMCLEGRGMVAPVCCPLLHGMAGFVPFYSTRQIKVFLVQERKDVFLPYGVDLCWGCQVTFFHLSESSRSTYVKCASKMQAQRVNVKYCYMRTLINIHIVMT